jgi:TRAP-type mannitol/chloroaromatic compound transport system substrate-binding protein
MSPRAALVAVVTAFCVGLLASLALRPAGPDDASAHARRSGAVRWRMPSAFGTNLPALGDNPAEVVERIASVTNGRLRVELFEPGELVPPFSIVDAVREEKVQAGYTWLGYDQGKLAVSALFGAVPFGMVPWEYMAWWFEGGGEDLAVELYAPLGVRPILCGLIGPETAGWFRTSVDRAEDLRGLKIRFAGLGGVVVQRLGASVTMLPGGEIFQALERGAIDATEFSLPVVDEQLGFDRVAKFNYFPGWHQPFSAFHLVVGERAWRGLDEPLRAAVVASCTAGVARNLARAEAIQGAVLDDLAERGIETRLLPADVLTALRSASLEVLDEQARLDPDFARVLEAQRAFSAEYARWRALAYPEQPGSSGSP